MHDTDHAPARSPTRWGPRIVVVLILTVIVPVSASLLYTFPPSQYSFLPCFWYKFTGLHCPGCGLTRCVHALMHLDLAQAFAYHPLFLIVLPFVAFGCFQVMYEVWTGRASPTLHLRPWMLWTLLIVIMTFGVARNIDVYPLNLLAPHEISAKQE